MSSSDFASFLVGYGYLAIAILSLAVGIGIGFGNACGKKVFDRTKKMLDTALNEQSQGHPELALQIADIKYETDLATAEFLRSKKHPAMKAAEEVKKVSLEKRNLLKENKVLTYQLNFYETLFPWLEEFKEVPISDALCAAKNVADKDYDEVRNWISPSEYQQLSPAKRNQLALDRWKTRKKNAWDIGIEFERFVGYTLEQLGYKVKYNGAVMGLEDMGRDLLASKGGATVVVQCKRWAKEKIIHEKHICQLYGSVAVLAAQNPGNKYRGVFITTALLSETAKDFAKYAGIEYVENLSISEYPLIKCNISKTGEKIYHLPMDQQYDRIDIYGKSGCFYANTVEEAENKGFRRAYRWHPNST